MGMKLHKLIKPELEQLKDNCNFSFAEMEVFEMLAKGKSIREISMTLCMSEASVNRRIKSIKDKVERNYDYGRKDSTYLGKSKFDS